MSLYPFPPQPRILKIREAEQIARMKQATYACAAENRIAANSNLPVDGGAVVALASTLSALEAALAESHFTDSATFFRCQQALRDGQAELEKLGVSRA